MEKAPPVLVVFGMRGFLDLVEHSLLAEADECEDGQPQTAVPEEAGQPEGRVDRGPGEDANDEGRRDCRLVHSCQFCVRQLVLLHLRLSSRSLSLLSSGP